MARISFVQIAIVALLVSCMSYASAQFATGNGAPIKITSVVALGNMTDTHLATTAGIPNRDGGSVGTVGGKICWFWSDTEYFKDGKWTGWFAGNSGSLGNASDPIMLNGPQRQAIPFTSEEAAWNTQYSDNPRVVLWPTSGVVEITPGHGLLWVERGYYGSSVSGELPGIVLSNVTIGSDGYCNVTRLSNTVMFPGINYGAFATTKDDTYAYLFSGDDYMFTARVPIADAANVAKYTYWNADTKVWNATQPTSSETAKASFYNWVGQDGGIFYSAYHQAWLMILTLDLDLQLWMYSAFAPQGPWVNKTLLYDIPEPADPSVAYVYGTVPTNLYDPTGASAVAQFSWCYTGGYDNWMVQINWNVTNSVPPSPFVIQSVSNGDYVLISSTEKLEASTTSLSSAAVFTYGANPTGGEAIRSNSSKEYVSANGAAGGEALSADEASPNTWESFSFKLVDPALGYWAIVSNIDPLYVAVTGTYDELIPNVATTVKTVPTTALYQLLSVAVVVTTVSGKSVDTVELASTVSSQLSSTTTVSSAVTSSSSTSRKREAATTFTITTTATSPQASSADLASQLTAAVNSPQTASYFAASGLTVITPAAEAAAAATAALSTGAIVGIAVGGGALLAAVVGGAVYAVKRRSAKPFVEMGSLEPTATPQPQSEDPEAPLAEAGPAPAVGLAFEQVKKPRFGARVMTMSPPKPGSHASLTARQIQIES